MDQNDYIILATELMQQISADLAWHYHIIPKIVEEQTFTFHISDAKPEKKIQEELEFLTGKKIVLDSQPAYIIENTLNRYYLKKDSEQSNGKQAVDVQSEEFITQLIHEAKTLNSSDIHIEIYEETCRVRIRIDGKLVERYILPKEDYPALVNKIKIMAHLDIAEKRLPQDGRIFYKLNQYKFDIRVSILPTLHGEKIVMRLLGNDATDIDIKQLGFSKEDLFNYQESIKKPNGILLISGPTGSGKTTTLYATLKLLNDKNRNIMTIEDPIEYTLEGINQVQLKESIGLNFAQALRTFLRQDPDIIMVGEIRDQETANMAIRASLTGHLVLSTIHTNSAWGTISRLTDMNIPPYLIANTLNASVAQRLVRKLCGSCKTQKPFDESLYPKHFKPPIEVENHFVPIGCKSCYFTGYKGRIAIYEVISIDGELAEQIKSGNTQVYHLLKERGIKTLGENAFEVFQQGNTSLEEVYTLLQSHH